MLDKKGKLAFTFVSFILSFLISIQVNIAKKSPTADNISLARANELSIELERVKAERDSLAETVATLKAYKDSTSLVNESLNNDALLVAGTSEVEGPGIKVTLNDSAKVINPEINPNVLLIHDEDILSVINELFVSGAEAISINGQRIISTSYVRCVGPVVNINGTRLSAPFIVSAIGDPQTLESALKIPGGVVDNLTPWGINISITPFENIIIPAYDGLYSTKYIKRTIDKEDK